MTFQLFLRVLDFFSPKFAPNDRKNCAWQKKIFFLFERNVPNLELFCTKIFKNQNLDPPPPPIVHFKHVFGGIFWLIFGQYLENQASNRNSDTQIFDSTR